MKLPRLLGRSKAKGGYRDVLSVLRRCFGATDEYCSRCGSQLVVKTETIEIEASENRLREEMIDLFWLTVIGLGIILGGIALIRGVLKLNEWILIAYMLISSTAFAINFGFSVWQIRRLARLAKGIGPRARDTGELGPGKEQLFVSSAPSVTEHTTRQLETASGELR